MALQRLFFSLENTPSFTKEQTWAGKNGEVKLDVNSRASSHLSLETS